MMRYERERERERIILEELEVEREFQELVEEARERSREAFDRKTKKVGTWVEDAFSDALLPSPFSCPVLRLDIP